MADAVLSRPPTAWSSCRGPMGAAYLGLKRTQWSFASPFVIRDPEGNRHILTSTSPSLLQEAFKRSWDNKLSREAAKKMGPDGAKLDCQIAQACLKSANLSAMGR
eukprot:2712998-Pyramimonas_sp.AAC.1